MLGYLPLASVGLLLLGLVVGVVTSEMLGRKRVPSAKPVKRRTSRSRKRRLEGSPAEAAAAVFKGVGRR